MVLLILVAIMCRVLGITSADSVLPGNKTERCFPFYRRFATLQDNPKNLCNDSSIQEYHMVMGILELLVQFKVTDVFLASDIESDVVQIWNRYHSKLLYARQHLEEEMIKISLNLVRDTLDVPKSNVTPYVVVFSRNNTYIDTVLRQGKKLDLIRFPVSWLVTQWNYPHNVSEELHSIVLDSNQQIFFASVDAGKGSILFLDYFWSPITSHMTTLQFGSWSERTSLQFEQSLDKFYKNGLHGKEIRVITFDDEPYSSAKGNDTCTGYLPNILTNLGTLLNFRLKFEIYPEQAPNPLLNKLRLKGTDIGMVEFSMTKSRKKIMLFSPPILSGSNRFVIKRPSGPSGLEGYLSVCTPEVWASVISIIILIPLAICFSHYQESKHYNVIHSSIYKNRLLSRKNKQNREAYFPKTFRGWICYFICGRSLEDANSDRLQLYSIRLFIVIGTFTFLVLFRYYQAQFVAILSTDNSKIPFTNMYGLVELDYLAGFLEGANIQEAFQDAKEGEFAQLWKLLSKTNMPLAKSYNLGIERAYAEKYAFMAQYDILRFRVGGNCSFTIIPTDYFKEHYHFGFRIDFPFFKLLSVGLLKLNEIGTIDKLWMMHLSTMHSKCSTSQTKAIDMDRTYFMFALVCGGLFMSIFALIFEYVHFRRKFNTKVGFSKKFEVKSVKLMVPISRPNHISVRPKAASVTRL